jgi:hypothetical protein
MVNGEDYNNFPYTLYSSIIKSKAVNRSSVGVSKNLDLLDPTGKYSSIESYASDGALYLNTDNGYDILIFNNTTDIITYLSNKLAGTIAGINANQYYQEYYPRGRCNRVCKILARNVPDGPSSTVQFEWSAGSFCCWAIILNFI